MELVLKTRKAKKAHYVINEFRYAKEVVINKIGTDLNKSIANILGLVSLMDDSDLSDQDFKTIKLYLSKEAKELSTLISNVYSQ